MTDAIVEKTIATDVAVVEEETAMVSMEQMDNTPMFMSLRPWAFTNVTAVTVDCRRHPKPLIVTVSHGYALTVAMFDGLLGGIYRGQSFIHSSTPMTTWQVDTLNSERTRLRDFWKKRQDVSDSRGHTAMVCHRAVTNRGDVERV